MCWDARVAYITNTFSIPHKCAVGYTDIQQACALEIAYNLKYSPVSSVSHNPLTHAPLREMLGEALPLRAPGSAHINMVLRENTVRRGKLVRSFVRLFS